MEPEEKKQLEEQRNKMIEDAKWSIEYHTQKLAEAKATLKLLNV